MDVTIPYLQFQIQRWLQQTDAATMYSEAIVPPEEFFVSCRKGIYSFPCPEVELHMSNVGICYTMMNKPETTHDVSIAGYQNALTFELDIAQWDYTSQSVTKGAGVSVSVYVRDSFIVIMLTVICHHYGRLDLLVCCVCSSV